MVVLFEEQPDGELCVQVNPYTGRIYGFYYDYPVIAQEVPDPNVTVVRVDATIEEFAAELDKGLQYKAGKFFRPVRFTQPSYLLLAGSALVGSFVLPEEPPAPEYCAVQLLQDDQVLGRYETLVVTKEANFEIRPTLPTSAKVLKLVVETNNYGTASAPVAFVTQSEIDKAKIRVEAFGQAIPPEQLLDFGAAQDMVKQLSKIDMQEVLNVLQNSELENKEALIELAKAQLKLPEARKGSLLDKLKKLIKGGQDE